MRSIDRLYGKFPRRLVAVRSGRFLPDRERRGGDGGLDSKGVAGRVRLLARLPCPPGLVLALQLKIVLFNLLRPFGFVSNLKLFQRLEEVLHGVVHPVGK